ncbi:unnamed protein product [Caenorhabditis angaria]|uniref:Uncharacterized protein n=1 Tax=Caenorhabditis angaria TaxID=860376 RepID=A0A9P1IBJ8_9PELO|nr:unnamed protein product [Caenorhabditis angaria]
MSSEVQTTHKIGLITAISYTVGDIVGSGIFVTPTSILNHAGSVGLSLCLWAICAFISLFGALSYVELGTTIRKSGCDFAYLSYFGWRPLAASFMWVSTCLSYPAVLAIQAVSLGEYVITEWAPGGLVLAIYSGLFAYNGWDVLNFGAEEIENPRRTLPIAAMSGITISAVVFILMNISYFSVLSVQDFKSSPAVAVTFAERTLGDFHYVIPFLISLLLIGSMNTTIFACSRYMHSGAEQGVMPSMLRLVNLASNSPRMAVFFEVLIAICLSFIGDLDHIISYMSFALWSQRTATQAGFIYFKFTGKFNKSENPDRFIVPILVPIVFFAICIMLLVIPIIQNYQVAIYGLSLTAGGALIYIVFIYPDTLPNIFYQINDRTVKFCQLIFNASIPSRA